MKDLESKNRGLKKILITDEAISHVKDIRFEGLTAEESEILNQLNRRLLRISKDENQSNEDALTICFHQDADAEIGIAFGDEHSVDPDSDADSYHILNGTNICTVIVTHNHPSLSLISLNDVEFFLKKYSVRHFVAVTNLGVVSYLYKMDNYDYEKSVTLYNQCVDMNNEANGDLKKVQDAASFFLHHCFECGISYVK